MRRAVLVAYRPVADRVRFHWHRPRASCTAANAPSRLRTPSRCRRAANRPADLRASRLIPRAGPPGATTSWSSSPSTKTAPTPSTTRWRTSTTSPRSMWPPSAWQDARRPRPGSEKWSAGPSPQAATASPASPPRPRRSSRTSSLATPRTPSRHACAPTSTPASAVEAISALRLASPVLAANRPDLLPWQIDAQLRDIALSWFGRTDTLYAVGLLPHPHLQAHDPSLVSPVDEDRNTHFRSPYKILEGPAGPSLP